MSTKMNCWVSLSLFFPLGGFRAVCFVLITLFFAFLTDINLLFTFNNFICQSTRRAIFNLFNNFFSGSIEWLDPRSLLRMINVRQRSHAHTCMNTQFRLPHNGDFTVGIFHFLFHKYIFMSYKSDIVAYIYFIPLTYSIVNQLIFCCIQSVVFIGWLKMDVIYKAH